jgi:NADH-quinone oxidoreductase subunit M
MSDNAPLLSLMIWLPLAAAVGVMALGDQRPLRARLLALTSTVLSFGLSLLMVMRFDAGSAAMQFVERVVWIDSLSIHYALGVDGIAVPLIVLTAFTSVIVVLAGYSGVRERVAQYNAAFLLLQGLMTGLFCATDAVLFYLFFEAMLIPMFLIIGIWGGPRRVYAAIKFFLYTFLGSVFLLLGLVYLYRQGGSFALADLQALPLSADEQFWLFLAFLVAFAVKIPMFPVHTWLPDAHVEAPTGGSVVLAAVMLKVGGYGLLRFNLPVTPDASAELGWLVVALSLLAIIYIGLVALVQQDMKKLIAYSSISHMGFVTLGLFVMLGAGSAVDTELVALAMAGGIVQMLSHGLISAAMFLLVGVLYERLHSRDIADYGGVAASMPVFAGLAVFFAMANSGLPGTSGFIGEFMVILASFAVEPIVAALAALTLIIGAAYTLWMVRRVFYGEMVSDGVKRLKDIGSRETFILGSLALAILALGVWPAPLLELMDASIMALVDQATSSKLPLSIEP